MVKNNYSKFTPSINFEFKPKNETELKLILKFINKTGLCKSVFVLKE